MDLEENIYMGQSLLFISERFIQTLFYFYDFNISAFFIYMVCVYLSTYEFIKILRLV